MKEYYPIDMEMLHKEIQDDQKIQNMIHKNFCRYLKQKGKNKNKFCLNKFKDINELKYCATHRYELKPYIKCIQENCNGNTKKDLCKKCRSFYNKKIPKIRLPNQDDNELNLLQNYNGLLKEIVYPNGKYFIKNYNDHYKDTIVKINLILPKYNEEGNKIKTINKDNYICLYNPFMTIRMKFELKGCINHYNTYINNLYNKYNINSLLCLSKIFNNRFRNFISLDKACNVPLPPVTNDEEILLNLDNLQKINNSSKNGGNEIFKKPIWEENKNCKKINLVTSDQNIITNIYEIENDKKCIDAQIQCDLLNDAIIENKLQLDEKGNKCYYHYINKNYNTYITELPLGFYKRDMQIILYKENGFEVTNDYILNKIKIYMKNKKKNKKKSDRKKNKKLREVFNEVIKKDISEKDIEKDDEKTYCLNMEMTIINKKYGLNLDFIEIEIKKLIHERNKVKQEDRKFNIKMLILQKINEVFNRKVNEEIKYFQNNIKSNKALYDQFNILIDSFIKDLKYLLKFYINDYNYFENNFKSLVMEMDD